MGVSHVAVDNNLGVSGSCDDARRVDGAGIHLAGTAAAELSGSHDWRRSHTQFYLGPGRPHSGRSDLIPIRDQVESVDR